MRHLWLFVLFLAYGYAWGEFAENNVLSTEDKFGGSKIHSMIGNEIVTDTADIKIEINMEKTESEDRKASYVLIVTYEGRESMLIDGLILLIDGERKSFPHGDTRKNVLPGGHVREFAFFISSERGFRELAAAKKVEVTVKGRESSETGRLVEKNIENFKRFIAEYVDVREKAN
jgi:hypothetical protein